MQMNSCILSICIIIRAIALQKNLATATKYSRSNMQEEKAINAKSDQISYNMHIADFQGYRFCTFRNIPFNVSSSKAPYQSTSIFLVFILRCSQYSHSVDFKQVELTQLRCMYTLVGVPQILSQNCILQEAHVSSLDQFYYSRFFSSCSVFQVICQNFCLKTSLLGTPNIFNCILRYQ